MNYFLQAFKKIFTYQGRARRAEYGWFLLINAVVQFIAGVLFFVLAEGVSLLTQSNMAEFVLFSLLIYAIFAFYGFLVFLVMLSLTTRRLHDLGWSGWWQVVIYVVPLIWNSVLFFLALTDKQRIAIEFLWLVQLSIWGTVIAYIVFNLLLLFKDGQKHPNKYGESPKYPSQPEQVEMKG